MTIIEALLFLILILLVGFILYYYFRGSVGSVEITRPMESRLDEYLDRRFDAMIDEWSLVRKPDAQRFRDEKIADLSQDEKRIAELKEFERTFGEKLSSMEERLESLEKQVIR